LLALLAKSGEVVSFSGFARKRNYPFFLRAKRAKILVTLTFMIIDSIFTAFTTKNVLIVGDVMIDRYWYGKVNRISPEAPVPIVEFQKAEDRLGGAANVALNVKALGATPYLFSILGKDTEGVDFQKIMKTHELSTEGLVFSEERKTTVKTRIMASTQQMLRVDSEITHDISPKECQIFIKKIKIFMDRTPIDVIIFQDYNKGVLSALCIELLMHEAQKRQIPTIIDPKKKNFLAYKGATLFKPNLKEIREAVPFEVKPTLDSLQKATDYLAAQTGQLYTMITLSEKGLYLIKNTEITGGGKIYPTQARNIADVSGAGDTVVSIAALGIACSLSLEAMAILSNLAGGQVCETAGVVPVNLAQLKEEMRQFIK
jgi:D-glycero-beta-D-manno-heptose-7-phosphate kinase